MNSWHTKTLKKHLKRRRLLSQGDDTILDIDPMVLLIVILIFAIVSVAFYLYFTDGELPKIKKLARKPAFLVKQSESLPTTENKSSRVHRHRLF